MTDLSRFERFLAIPVQDINDRSELALSETELGELHTLLVKGEVSKNFYYQINNALKADFIFRQSGRNRGWTVGYIREQLGRTSYRRYSRGGEDIHEWVSGRLWPNGSHIETIRSRRDPVRIIHEVELAFSPEADLKGLWERQKPGLEEEGIELLQQFPDNQFVQDMCFLPTSGNFTARIVLSAGKQRKILDLPIALRYRSFLKRLEKKYKLDTGYSEPKPEEPLQRASTEELQEALAGISRAVKKYKKSKGSLGAYIKKMTEWHMGEEFKRRSKEIKDPETGKTRRVLLAGLEREGGSLDDPIKRKDGTEAGTLGDTIADPHAKPPDQGILLQEILDSFYDETDRKIVHLLRDGYTQNEIARKLCMTQPAIAKRRKRLCKKAGH